MEKKNRPADTAVAGVIAPASRLTPYALFLIASGLSVLVALPLWMIDLKM